MEPCCCFLSAQYADPVADLLDKWGIFRVRLFRDSCIFHRGNYVKVRALSLLLSLSVCLALCLTLCLALYMSVSLSVCLALCLSVLLSVCLSHSLSCSVYVSLAVC